jgi:hypothetical protein
MFFRGFLLEPSGGGEGSSLREPGKLQPTILAALQSAQSAIDKSLNTLQLAIGMTFARSRTGGNREPRSRSARNRCMPRGNQTMLGLVFSFEGDPEHDPVLTDQLPAQRAREAVSLAVNFADGIHFDEITDGANPTPKFAVIFSDLALVDAFTARLTLALMPTGIRIGSVRAIKTKESSNEDIAA